MAKSSKYHELRHDSWTDLGAAPLTLVVKSKVPVYVYISDAAPTSLDPPEAFVLPDQKGMDISAITPDQRVYARVLNNSFLPTADVVAFR